MQDVEELESPHHSSFLEVVQDDLLVEVAPVVVQHGSLVEVQIGPPVGVLLVEETPLAEVLCLEMLLQ